MQAWWTEVIKPAMQAWYGPVCAHPCIAYAVVAAVTLGFIYYARMHRDLGGTCTAFYVLAWPCFWLVMLASAFVCVLFFVTDKVRAFLGYPT